MPERRYLRPNEPLAIDERCLHADTERGAMFWFYGAGPKANERAGSVAVVHVREELDHHDSYCGDSYEAILRRLTAATTGDERPAWAKTAKWDENEEWDRRDKARYDAMIVGPPSAIIMCLDSPGGVVSGLNETVKSIRKLRRQSGIPIVAYVNEMAASAAYALACACDEIYCPPSAIIGSIGVISTMISQDKKNKKDGYDVRLITSGARKADGHVHAPISDAAIAVERGRLDQLADAFFRLASDRRGIAVDRIRKFEANIFLGGDAVKRRLADGIRSWDDLVGSLSSRAARAKKKTPNAGGNETDRREGLTGSKVTHTTKVQGTTMDFDELIKKAQASVAKRAAGGDSAKLMASAQRLSALQAAKKAAEEEDDEEDDEEEEDDDEAKKAKKAAKAAIAAANLAADKHLAIAAKAKKDAKEAAEKGPYGGAEDDEEAKAAKAVLSAVQELTGKRGLEAVGALTAIVSLAKQTASDVASLKSANRATEKAAIIQSARASAHVMTSEVEWLESQPLAVVKSFVEQRQKTGAIVNTEDGQLLKPRAPEGTEASLPKEVLDIVNDAVAAWSGDKAAYRKALVDRHLEAQKVGATATNGGRY